MMPIRCIGIGSNLSIRVILMDGWGGDILATGCERAPSGTIGACVKFILVDSEICRAGFDLGKYWPSFARVERAATETRSRKTTAALANTPPEEESSFRNRHRTCVSLFMRFEGSLLLNLGSNSMHTLFRHLNNTVSRIRKARIEILPLLASLETK